MNSDNRKDRPDRPAWQPVLLSLILPGGGQFLLGDWMRGITLLLSILFLGALVYWQGAVALVAPLAGIWLWGAWSAYGQVRGRRTGIGLPFLFGALILYGLGAQVTDTEPARLVTGWPRVQPYLRALVQPELLEYPTEDLEGSTPVQVPCIDPLPEPARHPTEDPRVTTSVACAAVGDTIQISGQGFFPETETEFWWLSPIGDVRRLFWEKEPLTVVTDAQGQFQAQILVPLAVPVGKLPAPGETQTHVIRVEQHRPYGSLQP
ncbi:MAG: hypothetical protein ACP5JJ_04860, partial [Anaerolineae bacterium]